MGSETDPNAGAAEIPESERRSIWLGGPPEEAGRKTWLTLGDGSKIRLEELDVPEGVKQLLASLDFDKNGVVEEHETAQAHALMGQLRHALDVSGDGNVSQQELTDGIELLKRMKSMQASNSSEMEYGHLPAVIQGVMKEWDADGSGKVGVQELIGAAKAFKQVQQEGRMMKKVILALGLVILLLLGGIFALTFVAIETTKEMRGASDGTMTSPSGEVVKVGSSDYEVAEDGSMTRRSEGRRLATCPEGRSCRVLGEARGSSALRVAAAEAKARLSSNLPDEAFKEIKQLTLKDATGRALALKIHSFTRQFLRSSKCGSIIKLRTDHGEIFLDDYDFSADERMEQHVKEAGFAGLFETLETANLGRRLSASDGMLEGFFNLLDDVEYACESNPLAKPSELAANYVAEVEVRHQHTQPSEAESRHFVDAEGFALDLPGIVEDQGRVLKTWKETMVKAGDAQAFVSEFAANPYLRELRVKLGGVQLRTELDVETQRGFRCVLEDADQGGLSSAAQSGNMEMSFQGLKVEGSLVLRHFQILIGQEIEAQVAARRLSESGTQQAQAMLEAGLAPNIVDYFDVDTDTSSEGRQREPGEPYRIVMRSDVPGSKIYTEKLYTSLRKLPDDVQLEDLLSMRLFDAGADGAADGAEGADAVGEPHLVGLASVFEACKPKRNASDAVWESELYAKAALLPAAREAVLAPEDEARRRPALLDPPEEEVQVPAELRPWSESPRNMEAITRRLFEAHGQDRENPILKRAMRETYWAGAVKLKKNRELAERENAALPSPFETSGEWDHYEFDWEADADPPADPVAPRRLRERRLQRLNGTDLAGAPRKLRRLKDGVLKPLRSPRRLGTYYPGEYEGQYTVKVSKEDLRQRRKPSRRLMARRLCGEQEADANFEFEADITEEKITVRMGVGAAQMTAEVEYCHLYEPFTGPPACQTGRYGSGTVVRGSITAAGQQRIFPAPDVTVNMDGAIRYDDSAGLDCAQNTRLHLHSEAARGRNVQDNEGQLQMTENAGGWESWQLVDAGSGKFYIKSHRNQFLQDNNGNVRLTSNTGGWEKWRVLGSEAGKMHVVSHRGRYLAVQGGGSVAPETKCTVTLYRDTDCRGGSRKFETSATGKEFKFDDDNWESAKVSGNCASVEFYDEDKQRRGYEDNVMWNEGDGSCRSDFPGDLDDDMNGLYIVAKVARPPADWVGTLALTEARGAETLWHLRTEAGEPACTAPGFSLEGAVTWSKDIDLGFASLALTTELGAQSAVHPVHGAHIAEIYGKGIAEIGPVTLWIATPFNPVDPWNTEYKIWDFCIEGGYEVDVGITTLVESMTIYCDQLNFR